MTEENLPARTGDIQIGALLEKALTGGVSVETVRALLDMRKELRAEQAREAFFLAFSAFQSECPAIERRKGIPDRHGNIKYYYAPIEDIIKQAGPVLTKHGFSYNFNTEFVDGGGVKVFCTIRHSQGHGETTTVFIPKVSVPNANEAQNTGAGVSYGKRFAFCGAVGIMTEDTDTDGVDPTKAEGPTVALTDDQAANIAALLSETNTTPSKFFAWIAQAAGCEVAKVTDIPGYFYSRAIKALESKRGAA